MVYYDLGPNFLTPGVELLPGEVRQLSKRNSQYFRSYLRKTTEGLFGPPIGARVKHMGTTPAWRETPSGSHKVPSGIGTMDFRPREVLFFWRYHLQIWPNWFQIFTPCISAQAPISINMVS